jgi:hypothetical protein
MTYDKAYFIAKFEAIPEDKWTTRHYRNDEGQCCAVGHCLPLTGTQSQEKSDFLILGHRSYLNFIEINDGRHSRYQQPTPKQRVLAALKDLP